MSVVNNKLHPRGKMPPTSEAAVRLGLRYYFTGQPCPRGHIAPRVAGRRDCSGCLRDANKARRKKRRREDVVYSMWHSARYRARQKGVPFSITQDDILRVWPRDGLCPITGQRFGAPSEASRDRAPQAASLDRVDPRVGYVPGNIAIISNWANKLKADATDPEIFRRLADWLEGRQKISALFY